jgi:trimeric autotransporter adhesin
MKMQRLGKPLMWLSAILMTTLVAACGGGDQGRGAILGLPSADLVSVAVTPATAAVPSGAAQQFIATATFADGASRDVTTAANWTSATTSVATVAATGLATGVSPGSAVIAASFGGKGGNATLTVLPATLSSIAVTPAAPSIGIGATQQFVATGTYSDGSIHDITGISTFTSATPTYATITAGGLATGVTVGTTVVSAASGTRTGSTSLTVTPATLSSLALTPANPVLLVGATEQMIVRATYSDGTAVDVSAGSAYSSATPATASIGAASGLTTALAAGTSVVSASFGGMSASTKVTVSANALTSITVTPANATVAVGATQAFIATGNYADGSSANITGTASWTSGTTSVATILPTGVASALTIGSSVITASSGGSTATANLTVAAVAPTLSTITVSPANSTVAVGASPAFTATGNYSDGSTSDITGAVTWNSGTTTVATIVATGVANALNAGSTVITATSGSKSGNTNLTVTASAPPAASVNMGTAASFGVLAGTSITNNSGGTTLVTGDVGAPSQTTDPTQAAGFNNYKSGAILAGALADLQVAITDARSRTCTVNSASGIDLGGLVFTPGVYCYAGAINVTGTFTMNGPGVYIFRTSSTIDTTANSIIALTGGASAADVSWVPTGPTTLGAVSVFKGTIMSLSAAITLGDGANLQNGRVLTEAAATLRNNKITTP